MNVVMTGDGRLIEVQGTAEGTPFSRARPGRPAGARRGRDRGRSAACSCAPARRPVIVLATANTARRASSAALLRVRVDAAGRVRRPRRTGATFAANALHQGPRGAGRRRRAIGAGRRLRHRGRGPRRRARRPRARYGGAAWTTRAASATCWRSSSGVNDRRAALRLRAGRDRRRTAPSWSSRAGGGHDRARLRRRGRLRLRPDLRARRRRPAPSARCRPPRRTRCGTGAAPQRHCAPRWAGERRRPPSRRGAGDGHQRVLIAVKVVLALVTGSVRRPGRGHPRRGRAATDDRGGVRGAGRRPAGRHAGIGGRAGGRHRRGGRCGCGLRVAAHPRR